MKYSKYYRLAITCLAVALGAIVWVAAALTVLTSPAATMSLFFVPSLLGVALMLGINFWFKGENRRFGRYQMEEPEKNSWN
jgi:hypothetical protein